MRLNLDSVLLVSVEEKDELRQGRLESIRSQSTDHQVPRMVSTGRPDRDQAPPRSPGRPFSPVTRSARFSVQSGHQVRPEGET